MRNFKEMLNWGIKTDDSLYNSQRYFLISEVISCFAYSVVDGVFLSSLLLLLGASDLFIALMFSTQFFCYITQVITPIFYERYKYRKTYMIVFLAIHRFSKCFIIFIPLVFPKGLWMPLIFGIYLISNLAASFNSPAHNNLCISLLPEQDQYWFMPLRQALTMIVVVLVYAILGKTLDEFHNSYKVYIIAYILSFITSIFSLIFFSKIIEPENKVTVLGVQDYLKNFISVFKDMRYIRFTLFTFIFYIALYLSSSYKGIYMLKYLESSYAFVALNESLVNVIVIILSVALIRYAKKVSWISLLKYSLFFYVIHFVLLALTSIDTILVYVLHSIMLGIATAAFNLSILNYRYQIMPDGNKTFYDSTFGIAFGIAALTAPFAGVWAKNLIMNTVVNPIMSFRILFCISSALVMVSYFLFIKFKKLNDVSI